MTQFGIVFVTVPNAAVGKQIARSVVTEKLAACVNIVPGLTSIYHWQGNICEDDELLLIIKTDISLFTRLKNRVLQLHPYEVPEIIMTRISAGSEPYLQWIGDNTKSEAGE